MSSPLILILGIVVLLLGAAFIGGWFDWVLDVMGFILVVIGVIAVVMGVVGMLSGRNNPGRF